MAKLSQKKNSTAKKQRRQVLPPLSFRRGVGGEVQNIKNKL